MLESSVYCTTVKGNRLEPEAIPSTMNTNEFASRPRSFYQWLGFRLVDAELSLPAQDTATVLAAIYGCAIILHVAQCLIPGKRVSALLLLPGLWEAIAFALRGMLGEMYADNLLHEHLPLRTLSTALLLLAPSWQLIYIAVGVTRLSQRWLPRDSRMNRLLSLKQLAACYVIYVLLVLMETSTTIWTRNDRFFFRFMISLATYSSLANPFIFRAILARFTFARRSLRLAIALAAFVAVITIHVHVILHLAFLWLRLPRKEDYVYTGLALPLLLALVGVDLIPEYTSRWGSKRTPEPDKSGEKGSGMRESGDNVVTYRWGIFWWSAKQSDWDNLFRAI